VTRAWIVIPTYNEAENLPSLVAAVLTAMASGGSGVDCSILIVDDSSPDGTGHIADALAAAHGGVHVLHRPEKAGLAGADIAGFRLALAAGADYVLEMDADFSPDPATCRACSPPPGAGADVVLGSRYVRGGGVDGWPWDRGILSRAGGLYARAALASSVRDLTGGFKCFRASSLRALDFDTFSADGYAFQVETTYRAGRAGLRIEEVPIVCRERRAGRSKMSLAIAVEAVLRIPGMRLAANRAAVARGRQRGAAGHAPVMPGRQGA